ncbi:MAG: Mbeg1-like protein [Lachnospiraceae bacterium]|jgi:hypothetical protein
MPGMLDYIKWRGDLDFKALPLNVVDAMIFCELSYWDLGLSVNDGLRRPAVTIGAFCEQAMSLPLPEHCIEDSFEFGRLLIESKRFSSLPLLAFENIVDNDRGKQFAAYTVSLGKKSHFIAIRGTDHSLVGWKENLMLSYNEEVPAQKAAVEYISRIASATAGTLYIGGHSKGGNLAVYGATFSSPKIRSRIKSVFNFDGPGFNEKVTAKNPFRELVGRIFTYVPQDSIIGLLLEHKEPYTVVQSNKSGMEQHNLFSWEVGPSDVVREQGLSNKSRIGQENISEWLERMTYEEKEQFIETLFALIKEYETIDNLFDVKNILPLIKAFSEMEKEKRRSVADVIGHLKDTVIDNIKERFEKKKMEPYKKGSR